MDTMSIMQPTHSQSKPTAPAWRRVVPRMPWLLALLLGLSIGLLQAEAGDRAIGVAPSGPPGSVSITGEYWAVLIGIDEYAFASNLESAVKDVQAVRAVLESRYGFHPSRIKQLLNTQATRKNIENTLYALSREAGPEDSVFIYYAGHGQYDQARDHGWWVPTNGEPRQAGTLITNATILRYIKGMQAKHVYLVADSCFSGSLFGTRALPPDYGPLVCGIIQRPLPVGIDLGGDRAGGRQGTGRPQSVCVLSAEALAGKCSALLGAQHDSRSPGPIGGE